MKKPEWKECPICHTQVRYLWGHLVLVHELKDCDATKIIQGNKLLDAAKTHPIITNTPRKYLINLLWGRFMDAGVYSIELEGMVKDNLNCCSTDSLVELLFKTTDMVNWKYNLKPAGAE